MDTANKNISKPSSTTSKTSTTTKKSSPPNSDPSSPDDYTAIDDSQIEVLDDEPKSILLGIVSQLSKGTDLHRVTLPTFVLEPRSMLERITDFMYHHHLILDTHRKSDSIDRFVDVVRYFVSGWHIRPQGVKKPYNPVLGEFFRCSYKYLDTPSAFYVAEQTSHHPPISNYFFCSPLNHLLIQGELKPRSKFMGNSACTIMAGETSLQFTNLSNEVYRLNLPNVYARGILFGTMILELGDSVSIRCDATDLICDLDFKVKGYFTGTYNAISGKIRRISKPREILFDINGKWSDKSFIKPVKGEPTSFFDAEDEKITPKIVPNEPDQHAYESRKLWTKVTSAISCKDLDTATEEKNKIEAMQRMNRIKREELADDDSQPWAPRFFCSQGDDPECFEFKLVRKLAKDPMDRLNQLDDFIFKNPPPHPYGDEPAY